MLQARHGAAGWAERRQQAGGQGRQQGRQRRQQAGGQGRQQGGQGRQQGGQRRGSRRTFHDGADRHYLSGEHAALNCQARRAVKLDVGVQLTSRQRRNHHHHWIASVWPRRLQEAAQAGAAAGLVAALLVSRCRQGGQAGGWVPPSGERCSEAASVCVAEGACAGAQSGGRLRCTPHHALRPASSAACHGNTH